MNTTQAEPSAWSLAEDVPEGRLGFSLCPCDKEGSFWCDGKSSSGSRMVSAAKSSGGVGWSSWVLPTHSRAAHSNLFTSSSFKSE